MKHRWEEIRKWAKGKKEKYWSQPNMASFQNSKILLYITYIHIYHRHSHHDYWLVRHMHLMLLPIFSNQDIICFEGLHTDVVI